MSSERSLERGVFRGCESSDLGSFNHFDMLNVQIFEMKLLIFIRIIRLILQ